MRSPIFGLGNVNGIIGHTIPMGNYFIVISIPPARPIKDCFKSPIPVRDTNMTDLSTHDALVIHGKGDLRMDRIATPPPGPGEVRVRIAWGGICGSDMHYLRHGGVGASVLREPMVLGHEVSGTVEACGPDVHGWQAGEPVAIHPAKPCGTCPECRRGLHNLCRNMRFFGSAAYLPHTQGGFRRTMTVAASQLHRLPPGLDLRRAALAEPFAVALHAIARAGSCAGKSVLVQGAGPIGALIVAGLAVRGAARIVAADLHDFPLSVARRLGATETWNTGAPAPDASRDEEFDIVFEATGVVAALPFAIAHTRRGGVLVQVGMFPPGTIEVPMAQIIARELDLRGTFRFDAEFAEALDLLAAHPQIADGLVTHEFAFDAYAAAFDASSNRQAASKVMLEIGG
ncbi:L-idonate 5-dehydrogenase [Gluconacetobacter diazotrophicus PA1 5]|uniref:L-idonate 5-dehydrogenase n=2 Tax=Gluconacetobacter diazotrophicus TaxID=33996 RepID=A9HDU6_GLUDA|nr:L-idonate 5-dehydrogenase [Gluconacetobacter diazotrophicus PA1 5]